MNDKWISFEDVSLYRNQRKILSDINWSVTSGTHWVVLGANGSGKTTLLRLLAGYLWPSTGKVTVLGKQFGTVDLRELRKQIGWVGSFLEAQIPPAMRPLDLIVSGKFASIGIFEQPQETDYRHARALAEELGCSEILDVPYGVLSQGEKQRLLIARALIHRPKLLILDEPCAGLDLVAREQLLALVDELGEAGNGITMILVTHHLQEIMPTFTHALLLKAGSCIAHGEKGVILCSDLLSQAFGIPVKVNRDGNRFWAQIPLEQ